MSWQCFFESNIHNHYLLPTTHVHIISRAQSTLFQTSISLGLFSTETGTVEFENIAYSVISD
jgi:hypothetical protein